MNRVVFNKKKFLIGLTLALISLIITLVFGFSIRVCLLFILLFVTVGIISFSIAGSKWLHGVCICVISAAEIFCIQILSNAEFAGSVFSYLLNILCIVVLIVFIYIITTNLYISAGIGLFAPLFLATVNYYVYLFRGNELQPIDIFSVSTAANVVSSYKIELTPTIFYAWELAILIFFFCFYIANIKQKRKWGRISFGVAEVFLLLVLVLGTQDLASRHWENYGTIYNGYILNFCLQIKEAFVTKPTGYTSSLIVEYENEYRNTVSSDESNEEPAIIVIMDESFSDLSVLGNELNTNTEVTPFLDSLFENTVRGYALSSVFGGSTPNSEFEFLTGNTMAFLPNGSIPYQQYVKSETSSLVSELNNMDYYSIATHPYLSSGWMRTTVYPLLQFDTFTFVEDYPQTNLLRGYVSDQEMFERIIEYYENRDKTNGFFLFGVTMQNHGGYTYEGTDFETTIHLEGYQGDYPDVEQYLSLIHETDKALEYLLSYFEEIDEPVVIVFYGDHLPNLDSDFFEEVHGGTFDTLDEQELRYMVPFFIWANYDIEEEYVSLTSLNYLSTYLMEVAGVDKSAYQQFLSDTKDVIPAINAYGYYSVTNGCFMDIDDAEREEAEALLKYQQIQYNGLFDSDNRSDVFFPD